MNWASCWEMQRLCQLFVEGPNSWNKPDSTSLSQESCTGKKSIDAHLPEIMYQHEPASAQILLMLTSCKKCGPRMSKCGDQWKKLAEHQNQLTSAQRAMSKGVFPWRISRFCPLDTSRAAPALRSCHRAPQIQEAWASSWKEGWGVHAFSSHSTKWRQRAQDTQFRFWISRRNSLCRTSGKEMKGVRKKTKTLLAFGAECFSTSALCTPKKEGKVWFGMSSPKIDKKNLGGWIENDSKRIWIDFFKSLLSLCSHGTSSLSIWYLLRLAPVGIPIRCFWSISSKPFCSRKSILSERKKIWDSSFHNWKNMTSGKCPRNTRFRRAWRRFLPSVGIGSGRLSSSNSSSTSQSFLMKPWPWLNSPIIPSQVREGTNKSMINVSFDFSSIKLTVIPPPQSSSMLHRHEKENHLGFKIGVKFAMTLTLPSPPTALAKHHSKRTLQLAFPEVSAITKKKFTQSHTSEIKVTFGQLRPGTQSWFVMVLLEWFWCFNLWSSEIIDVKPTARSVLLLPTRQLWLSYGLV